MKPDFKKFDIKKVSATKVLGLPEWNIFLKEIHYFFQKLFQSLLIIIVPPTH